MVLNRMRAVSGVVLAGALAVASCSSGGNDDATAPLPSAGAPSATTVTAVDEPTPVSEVPLVSEPISVPETDGGETVAPIETSDPNVISRRTEGLDVVVLEGGIELPEGYSQAAVPVDAFAAAEFTVRSPSDPVQADVQFPPAAFESDQPVVVGGRIDASVSILSCRLVAVWALPHPDEIVIGYEEYPDLTCTVPLEHVATFEIPTTGTNSEGTWDYSTSAPIVPLRKVGPSD